MAVGAVSGCFLTMTVRGSLGPFGFVTAFGLGSSSHVSVPCLEQSVHTVSFAPSIMTLNGFPMILRPHISHRMLARA